MKTASPASGTASEDASLQSFSRGLAVIAILGRLKGPRTIATVAQAAGLPRAVVRRILHTLCALGYAATDGKDYRLTARVLTLGVSYLFTLPYLAHAQLALIELSLEIGESCALAIMDADEAVFILRIPSRKVLSPHLGVGSRLPAYATSPGRLLLAQLDDEALERYLVQTAFRAMTPKTLTRPEDLRADIARIRERGYAWVDGELDVAVAGLSVPVLDGQRRAVAALSVNVIAEGWTEAAAVRAYLTPLRRAAHCIPFE